MAPKLLHVKASTGGFQANIFFMIAFINFSCFTLSTY